MVSIPNGTRTVWYQPCLELKTKGEGLVLPSLEAQVSIYPESREIGIELRDKRVWSEAPAKRIVRFPDPEYVGARTAVANIATAYGLKGAWYTAKAHNAIANAARITREFVQKKYPLSWWRSRLVEGLSRGGTVTVQQADRMVKQALQALSHTTSQPQHTPAPTYAQCTRPVMPVCLATKLGKALLPQRKRELLNSVVRYDLL